MCIRSFCSGTLGGSSRDATVSIIAFSLVHFTLRWSDTQRYCVVGVIVFHCQHRREREGAVNAVAWFQLHSLHCHCCDRHMVANVIFVRAHTSNGCWAILWERVLLFGWPSAAWICHLCVRVPVCLRVYKCTRHRATADTHTHTHTH